MTHGTPGSVAAKEATTTIPIVIVLAGDAVEAGLVASVARPGGNVTGQTFFSPELAAKRLELLKEAVPHIRRVAILLNVDNPFARPDSTAFSAMKRTTTALGLTIPQSVLLRADQVIE